MKRLKGIDRKIEIENRRRVAFELRMSGLNYEAIAEQIRIRFPEEQKYSRQSAWTDVEAILTLTRNENQELASVAIQLELERLNQLWTIAHADALKGNLKSIEILLKISAARCALLGINAPIQLRIDSAVEAELTKVVESLRSSLPPETYRAVIDVLAKEITDSPNPAPPD
jgi:hypothetical protein